MKIECWVKRIYGDTEDTLRNRALSIERRSIVKDLNNRDLPLGKHIIMDKNGEPHEIEVVGPNVENAKYCPYNVCPPGSVQVGHACLVDIETTEPVSGQCPSGYVLGERTNTLDIIGQHGKVMTAKIMENNYPEPPDYGEVTVSEAQPKIQVETEDVCVMREPMPLTEENIKLVTDSIIGWGGYQEFPYWDIPWGIMDRLATERYHGAKLAGKGYAVEFYEYPDYGYLIFSDKKEAENAKDMIKYYESNKAFEDAKKFFIEEGGIPPEEVTDDMVSERLNFDYQLYIDDVVNRNPEYMGIVIPYQRVGEMYKEGDKYIYVTSKKNIVVGEKV